MTTILQIFLKTFVSFDYVLVNLNYFRGFVNLSQTQLYFT